MCKTLVKWHHLQLSQDSLKKTHWKTTVKGRRMRNVTPCCILHIYSANKWLYLCNAIDRIRCTAYLVCSNTYVFRINLHKLSQWILNTSSNGYCQNIQKHIILCLKKMHCFHELGNWNTVIEYAKVCYL